MIASITGSLAGTGLDWVIIQVAGVGIKATVPPPVVTDFVTRRSEEPVSLATTLVVREDSLTLYGFATVKERDTFEVLLSVSGIGPRIGLATLSVLSPAELSNAIENGDLKTLQRVPGIGKKSAQRLVLELSGKLQVGPEDEANMPSRSIDDFRTEVETALEQLGWSKAVARKTIEGLSDDYLDASSLLRAALMTLGSNRD